MEIEQQAEAQAAHSEVGHNLSVMRRQDIRNSFDFNDQLPSTRMSARKPSSNWTPL